MKMKRPSFLTSHLDTWKRQWIYAQAQRMAGIPLDVVVWKERRRDDDGGVKHAAVPCVGLGLGHIGK